MTRAVRFSRVTDWPIIASLCTAGGTLVLAVATFGSVRSANRAALAAERSLYAGLRPLLVPSRLEDPPEKVGFRDDHWMRVPGGRAIAEVTDEAIYLAMALRNVGSGIAVLDRWWVFPEAVLGSADHEDPEKFRRLTRDLYVPPSDRGFWQGALRDSSEPDFATTRKAIETRQRITIDLLYGDFEGGQRMISRFTLMPDSTDGWLVSQSRHWNLDRPEPR
jgi:hypothetical protein